MNILIILSIYLHQSKHRILVRNSRIAPHVVVALGAQRMDHGLGLPNVVQSDYNSYVRPRQT